MLFELDIIDTVCEELKREGYEIVQRKVKVHHKGADISATINSSELKERLYIDAVGETSSLESSKRYGKKFDRSQIRVHIAECVYACAKILSQAKVGGFENKAGIALPDNEDHREFIYEIQPFLEREKIVVFFVNQQREVNVLGKYV